MSDSMFYDDDDGRICHQCGGHVGNDGYTNDLANIIFAALSVFLII